MPIPYPDGLFMVEHAIRAPSGHNTQPWLFHLGADHITITPDLRRRLPVVDGDDRELFISLGCAVENLCLAAAARHWRTQVQVQESDAGPSRIRVDLTADATLAPPPLFDVLARSQTNRAMYDGRRVPTATLTPLLAACASPALPVQAWPRGSAEFERLASTSWKATPARCVTRRSSASCCHGSASTASRPSSAGTASAMPRWARPACPPGWPGPSCAGR